VDRSHAGRHCPQGSGVPGIFVIWDGMGLVPKRVERIPNSEPPTISIRSVNQEYPNYERQAEGVNIVDRVVWAAKRL
jgi:phage repressor protein C with HTH and peptisase S24 domain